MTEVDKEGEDTEKEEEGSDMEHDVEIEEDTESVGEGLEEERTQEEGEFRLEPNLVWEGKDTLWERCYFEVLQEDPDFGEGKTTRKPFYPNEDGFILKRHLGGGQNRVYIP